MDIWKYFQLPFYSKGDTNHVENKHVFSDLEQGQRLLTNRKKMKSLERGYNGVQEGFASGSGAETNAGSVSIQTEIENLEKMHDEFMVLIQKHASLEGLYHAGLQEYSQRMSSGVAGKNIRIGESIYYITKYGYYREYGSSSSVPWVNRNARCGGEPIEQDTSIDRLDVLPGPAMKETSMCGYEGTNVRYDGKIAYVKMNGEVLLYSNPMKPGDIVSCPKEIVDVDESTWDGLMSDRIGTMSKTTRCMVESLDIKTSDGMIVKEEIEKLLPEIQEKAKEIQVVIDTKVTPQIEKMNEIDKEEKSKFREYVKELNKKVEKGNEYTLNALYENTAIMERQVYIQYVAYLLLVVVGGFVIYMMFQRITGSVMEVVNKSAEVVRGAPRQSMLRSAAKQTSAFGGVGY